MIEFAKTKDFSELKMLWKLSFGDTEEYIDTFLGSRFTNENTPVYVKDGKIVSQLFLLSGKTKIADDFYSSLYIYAACTHPEHRGCGYMGDLLHFTFEYAKKNKIDYVTLVPGSESLFEYYKRFGFVPGFFVKELTLSRRQMTLLAKDNYEITELNPDIMSGLRDKVFNESDAFIWDREALKYALFEHTETGGRGFCIYSEGVPAGYALYHNENEKVSVKELVVRDGYIGQMFGAILKAAEAPVYKLRVPVWYPISSETEKKHAYAMIYPTNEKANSRLIKMNDAYFGLSLG